MPFDIAKLLSPKSVAIIGASVREGAVGARVVNNLLRLGYSGQIYPVNPRYAEVQGFRCYAALQELPERPDAVFVAIPAEGAVSAVEEAARCGIRAAVVNASGFADAGPEGQALQARLADVARKGNLAVCGPNNMGFINIHDHIGMYTARHLPKLRAGPIAVISQSGSVAIAITQNDRDLGLSHVITTGNEAVCTAADFLEVLARDDRVRVVVMFLEAIRDPKLFAAAALEAAERGKRIVALKVGRSDGGRASVAAHTGALSGDDKVYDAYFKRYGIIRAGDIDELLETALLLSGNPDTPSPRRLIALTVSGGEAALIADLGAAVGLPFAELSPSTLAAMRSAFPPFTKPRNPLDAWGLGWNSANFKRILDAVLDEGAAGAIVLAIDVPRAGGTDLLVGLDMAASCIGALGKTDKRFVFLSNAAGGGANLDLRQVLDPHSIPYLLGMRPAVAALSNWLTYEKPAPLADTVVRHLPELAMMADPERAGLLADAGVPMVEYRVVHDADEAETAAKDLGFPIVLKGTSPRLPHKTEFGLVVPGLSDSAALRAAYSRVCERLSCAAPEDKLARTVIQPFISDGVQLIIGARNDQRFGSVVVVGVGGVLVEVMSEVSLRIGPVDHDTARVMLSETKAAALLAGTRNRGPFDVDSAVDAIAAFSQFAYETSESIAAIEINPLIVRPKGLGAIGVDLTIEPACRRTGAEH